jgi:hypothetical protein
MLCKKTKKLFFHQTFAAEKGRPNYRRLPRISILHAHKNKCRSSIANRVSDQGCHCQTVYFKTKNQILSKCLGALDWKMLIFLWPFGIYLEYNMDTWEIFVHFVFIWYIFSGFGIMHQKIWQPFFRTEKNYRQKEQKKLMLSLSNPRSTKKQKFYFSV